MRAFKTQSLAALAAASLCLAGAASAAPVTVNLDAFSFAGGGQDDFADATLDEGDVAFAETGPLSITFSNLIVSNGATEADIDFDGLFFSADTVFNEVLSVDLTFSITATILSVDIDSTGADPGMTFQLSGVNGTSGAIPVDATGDIPFDMGTIPVFLAGQPYTLTHNLPTASFGPYFQIDEFEISPVPLPAGGVLLIGGLFGLHLLRRRRG